VTDGAPMESGACPTLAPMPPDQPSVAAPTDPVADAGGREEGRPRFRQEVEPADEPATIRPEVATRATRRRLLDDPDPDAPRPPRRVKLRARKVRRIVRHIEPWSVLKISVLFFLSVFLIICVASAVLWNAARSAGAVDDVEDFVTSLGFGNCEDIEGDPSSAPPTTATTIDGAGEQVVGGIAPTTTVTVAEDPETSTLPDEDGKCAEGQRLVGGFEFEDQRIFQAFALGGVVLVLAGAAASVVVAMLFNLISDLTGGVRVTVLEEESPRPRSGSPAPAARD